MLTPKHKERWAKEVEIMQRLDHPGVVKALPVPPELERELMVGLPLLCMEFCAKGDLRQVIIFFFNFLVYGGTSFERNRRYYL